MNAYIFNSFSLFFVIHFWFTQKIYSHNHFIIALLFSLVIPFTAFLLINRDDWIKSLPLGLLVFIFVVLLFLVKRSYRQINKLLIRKNLIRKDYDEKDFTYVLWDSDVNIPNWWDEKTSIETFVARQFHIIHVTDSTNIAYDRFKEINR